MYAEDVQYWCAVLNLFYNLSQKKAIATGISKCYVFAKVTDAVCTC
jgi:hypothetical protein